MQYTKYSKSDGHEIRQLFQSVFTESEGEEQGLSVSTLAYELMTTTDSEHLFGFTAVENQEITGCIFFSKLVFDSGVEAYILSPVAVATRFHSKGIGQALINFGIDEMKGNGAELLFTYGSPEYYAKVGFKQVAQEIAKAPVKLSLPFAWLGQSLVSDDLGVIKGNSSCVAALDDPDYW